MLGSIPMYAKVQHSESSIFVVFLASTSFALYNNRLATIVLICLCLQNRYITSVIVIIEDYRRCKCKDIYNFVKKEIFVRWKCISSMPFLQFKNFFVIATLYVIVNKFLQFSWSIG